MLHSLLTTPITKLVLFAVYTQVNCKYRQSTPQHHRKNKTRMTVTVVAWHIRISVSGLVKPAPLAYRSFFSSSSSIGTVTFLQKCASANGNCHRALDRWLKKSDYPFEEEERRSGRGREIAMPFGNVVNVEEEKFEFLSADSVVPATQCGL